MHDSSIKAIKNSDAKKIKEWIDKLIDSIELRNSYSAFSKQIKTLPEKRKDIHVYEGIDAIASAVGENLEEEIDKDSDTDFPYSYYFVYRGFQIFQLSKERMPLNNESD